MFRGTACVAGSTTNEVIPANPAVTIAGLYPPGVVFSQLAGTTTATTTVIVQNGTTYTVSTNYEGTIDW